MSSIPYPLFTEFHRIANEDLDDLMSILLVHGM